MERGLTELNGVQNVEVDLDGKKVTVNFDQSILSKEVFVHKIEDLGYEIKE